MGNILQRMKKEEKDLFSIAERYYSILSAVNGLTLTPREIQLIAFTAVKGNISYANNRKEFCEKHDTTSATINNLVYRLKKLGVFIKDGGKIKVNPIIVLDFAKPIVLEIKLLNGEAKESVG
jgi:DNA-binding MarR family transcriptional regulator